MNKRIAVAMSGGVDSAVAAALLKKQGWEVFGITMYFNLAALYGSDPSCCSSKGVRDARRVAGQLGIEHYALDMQQILQERVIKNFCQEYLKGRTPNPCVRCNQYLKFDALLKIAFQLGAQYLATGHYARISRYQGKCLLKKGKDPLKDQSYFLYRLNQNALRHTVFPLGSYAKNAVRGLAHELNLIVADRPASQEICFLRGGDYRNFLKTHLKLTPKPGVITDKEGKILGRHRGIAFYTIGQREGLGIALGYPAYIIDIDPKNNRIILGDKASALKREFLVKEPHFILSLAKKKIALKVKIRYNHQEALAEVDSSQAKIRVRFKKPQFAITPGQSAVFYHKDTVVGGGIIEEVLS